MMIVVVAVGASDAPGQVAVPAAAGRPCREHPQLVASCFTVRGRMTVWNGNPTVRIWPVGTTRILGVSDGRFKRDGYTNLPPAIAAKLSWDTALFGDFVVCPFTRDEPGVMRMVCVDSVTHETVHPYKRQDD